jgi:ferredoxin
MKIYYFSGSGNSYYVAKKIAKKTNGILVDIAKIEENIILEERVGVVVPCYAFGIPDVVVKFLKRVKNKSTYSFFILTYAGYYGGTFKQVNNLMTFNYNKEIKMSASDTVFTSKKSRDEKNEEIYRVADEEIGKMIKEIKTMKVNKISRSFEYYLLLPVYKLAMWYFKGAKRGFKTNEKCTLCGFCEKICPVDNIKVGDKVIWDNHCEGCLRCINYCPLEAIEYKKYTRGKVRFKNKRIDITEV